MSTKLANFKLNETEEVKILRIVRGRFGIQAVALNSDNEEIFLPAHQNLINELLKDILNKKVQITMTKQGKKSTQTGNNFNGVPFEYEVAKI
jgi:hypothetical protein